MKKIFLPLFLIIFIFSLLAGIQNVNAAIASGDLIKGSGSGVYYLGANGKRYVFPNSKTYFTWYWNFAFVKTISDQELSAMPLGGNVTYRPAQKLVKITTDPKVYAVAALGILRWITTEQVAIDLYGDSWANLVEDVPDPFFINYTIGDPIYQTSDFNKIQEKSKAKIINQNLGLEPFTLLFNAEILGRTDVFINEPLIKDTTWLENNKLKVTAEITLDPVEFPDYGDYSIEGDNLFLDYIVYSCILNCQGGKNKIQLLFEISDIEHKDYNIILRQQ